MIFYFIIALFLVLIACFFKKYSNGKKYFLFISTILLIIISGLRNKIVGVDTYMYVSFFEKVRFIPFADLESVRYEYGFAFFCKLVSCITSNYHIFLLIVSSFINFSVIKFIEKNSKNIYSSVILYVLCNFFFSYMNIMRQAIAISIILFGYEFLKKDKKIIYCLFVILAMQFHISSVLCLLLIPIKRYKYNKNFFITFFIVAISLFLFGKNIFDFFCSISGRLALYSKSEYASENFFGALLESLVITTQLLLGYVCLKLNESHVFDEKSNNMNILFGIVAFASVISILVMRATIFSRFLHYFSIFTIVWTPNCFEKIKNDKSKFYYKAITYIVFVMYFSVIGLFRPEWYGVVPYIFID